MKTNQLTLTRDSSVLSIKKYFETINELYDTHGMAFCVDFDTVWQLAYSRKDKAVESLRGVSTEDVDYQIFHQKGENPNSHNNGGRPTEKYMLTVPTLEWFIARRVPAVFEVYRQVFHSVRKQAAALPTVNQELVEKVFKAQRRRKMAWDRYQSEKRTCAMLKKLWHFVLRQRAHYVNKSYRSYVVLVPRCVATAEYILVFNYIQHWREQGFIITMNRTERVFGRFVAEVTCYDLSSRRSEMLLSMPMCEIGSKYGYFENM